MILILVFVFGVLAAASGAFGFFFAAAALAVLARRAFSLFFWLSLSSLCCGCCSRYRTRQRASVRRPPSRPRQGPFRLAVETARV